MQNRHYKNWFFFIFLSININAQIEKWTWSYKINVNKNKIAYLSNSQQVVYCKTDVQKFNQLVASWNSFRPNKGFFAFYIKPRIARTKKWDSWYKMFEWGNKVQRSFSTIAKDRTQYIHVRLELPTNEVADGFCLKVIAFGGADLSRLKILNVCISDFSRFVNEKFKKSKINLRSVKIKDIPKKSQMTLKDGNNKRMCSPTSTSMLVSYLLKKYVNPLDFAMKSYDDGLKAFGSWPFNTAHAFELCPQYLFKVIRLHSFKQLYSYLKEDLPIVVSIRGKLTGAPQDYNDGHLILFIGWDNKDKKVIVHDPAFDKDCKVEYKYSLNQFLQAWEKSHRLAYVAEKIK